MTDFSTATQLDPREEHFRIPGTARGIVALPPLPAGSPTAKSGRAAPCFTCMAQHFRRHSRSRIASTANPGATRCARQVSTSGGSTSTASVTPTAIRKWSSRRAENPPLCVAQDAARQLEAAVRFILGHQNIEKLSLISHSWGSMPTGLFAAEHPALVDRLVLFAPIGRREPRRYETPPTFPAWRIVTPEDQWNRFIEDVPAHEPPVLSRLHFDDWSKLLSRQRSGKPFARSGRREDAARAVQRDHQGMARPARLRPGAGPRRRSRSSAANGTA